MKTTKKDYEEFKRWCRHYQDKFHLNDWQLYLAVRFFQSTKIESKLLDDKMSEEKFREILQNIVIARTILYSQLWDAKKNYEG